MVQNNSMPRYRIHYLKEPQRLHFRQAGPSPAPARLKKKDYEAGGEIEATSPYAAWKKMRADGAEHPIDVGDALETEAGTLLLCKYVGFEEAQWMASPSESADNDDTASLAHAPIETPL